MDSAASFTSRTWVSDPPRRQIRCGCNGSSCRRHMDNALDSRNGLPLEEISAVTSGTPNVRVVSYGCVGLDIPAWLLLYAPFIYPTNGILKNLSRGYTFLNIGIPTRELRWSMLARDASCFYRPFVVSECWCQRGSSLGEANCPQIAGTGAIQREASDPSFAIVPNASVTAINNAPSSRHHATARPQTSFR